MPPAASKKPKKRQCKVEFEYQPVNEDELELKVGDVVDIIEEVEDGWWSGSLNGKSGLFPSNFVKELETAGEEAEINDTAADKTDGSGTEALVTPTSPQPDSGNGATQQPRRIIGVGFGDIFKDGSVKLRTRNSPIAEDKKGKDQEKDKAGPAQIVVEQRSTDVQIVELHGENLEILTSQVKWNAPYMMRCRRSVAQKGGEMLSFFCLNTTDSISVVHSCSTIKRICEIATKARDGGGKRNMLITCFL
ncbi:hypothetical protein GOODEAATRI_008829 [Goodea atripinnis]|uniref:SH3 domain-containing protein n=1 Tax=Goodea atripinnis TaxID=208336 RepID=A0ABV0PWG0_9TELE